MVKASEFENDILQKKKKTEFDILTFTQHRESGTADREIKPLQF